MTPTLSDLSHLMFGRRLRLRVFSWVNNHETGHFFQEEARSGVNYSSGPEVKRELGRLVDLGMLIRHEQSGSDRRQWYTRTESPLWRIVAAAAEQATDEALRSG